VGVGGRGAESYERKKAWPCISRPILSGSRNIVIPRILASEGVKGALCQKSFFNISL